MDLHIDPNSRRIVSLVKDLDIVREKDPRVDLNGFRAQLDKYQLPERIRQTAAAINEEIGYQALYLLYFLPPQHSVVRVSISKNKIEYIMKIVLRASGPAIVFHSVTRGHRSWRKYIYKVFHSAGSHIAFEQNFMPATITDEIIRGWFCFLVSGFEKKFKPEMSHSVERPSGVCAGPKSSLSQIIPDKRVRMGK
jgi:hypothetical protein